MQLFYLLSKDTNSYSSSNTSEGCIILFITQNAHGKQSINSNYVLGKKKKKKAEWKAIPEYLTKLVIAIEQYVIVKSVTKK